MSYVRIFVHLVFSTKYRNPLLSEQVRKEVFQHIRENCKSKAISLLIINGYTDHVHCLILLRREQSIAKISQYIKGESSQWINKNNLCERYFSWQNGYWAMSVGESELQRVINYIKNQETHHKNPGARPLKAGHMRTTFTKTKSG